MWIIDALIAGVFLGLSIIESPESKIIGLFVGFFVLIGMGIMFYIQK